MYKMCVFDFLHEYIILAKSPAKILFHLKEALKILQVCAHILGCQLKHSFHGICEHIAIISIHYTWGHVSMTLKMHTNSSSQRL